MNTRQQTFIYFFQKKITKELLHYIIITINPSYNWLIDEKTGNISLYEIPDSILKFAPTNLKQQQENVRAK